MKTANSKIGQRVIRFRNKGKKHYPLYDVVVTFCNNRNRGSFIEKLGFFNPNSHDKIFFLNTFRLGF
jgi:ribosomal protein S16